MEKQNEEFPWKAMVFCSAAIWGFSWALEATGLNWWEDRRVLDEDGYLRGVDRKYGLRW